MAYVDEKGFTAHSNYIDDERRAAHMDVVVGWQDSMWATSNERPLDYIDAAHVHAMYALDSIYDASCCAIDDDDAAVYAEWYDASYNALYAYSDAAEDCYRRQDEAKRRDAGCAHTRRTQAGYVAGTRCRDCGTLFHFDGTQRTQYGATSRDMVALS